MSLIIRREKTLKDTAIIFINSLNGKQSTKTIGDLTIIFSDNLVSGANLRNASKYFEVKEGSHSLNEKQKDTLKKMGLEFEPISFFKIGEIIEREPHPQSDKLFVLKIRTDSELQIVTNSINSTVGKKVVVACPGAFLPNGTRISRSKVMGIESDGMLCGGETLGKEKTEGVLIVDGENGQEYKI